MGEIISQIGLGLTVSVVGAEVGVPLMALGGWVSLSSNSLTAVSYGFEGKYDKMFGESVKIGIEYGVQKATGGLLKMKSPGQSEIANEAQRAVAEEINGKINSEGIKMIEVEVKTRNY